jgi:ABC-type phosphate/phosphonate transport system substrate-binding protein
MKKLYTLLACLLFPLPAFGSCDTPLPILYSPHYSASFFKIYMEKFHQQLEASTDCSLTLTFTITDEEFLDELLHAKFSFSILSKPAYEEINSTMLKAILKQDVTAGGYRSIIISRKTEVSSKEIGALKNKVIYSPGKLTAAYLYLEDELIKNNLLNDVTITDGFTHDIIMTKLLKGDAHSAVINEYTFNRLPANLKSKFIEHSHSTPTITYIVTHSNTPEKIIQSIKDTAKYIKIGPWVDI